MRHETPRRLHPLRLLLAAGVALAGLVAIVGSGGGSAGFPPCGSPCDNPAPPTPTAAIDPPYYTALVGRPASFTVSTANVTSTLSYQWQRSDDGGATSVDIAGATATTDAIANVNLADDKAVFRAQVRIAGVPMLQPVAHLAVSAVPGVVIQDTEFLASDWSASPVPAATGGPVPVHVEESPASGGNPGAYRKMTFQIPSGAGSAAVFYSSATATWNAATQGAIYVIDFVEDCIQLQSSTTLYTQSNLVIEQSGRRFLSDTFQTCTATSWSTVSKRAALAPADFRLFDGPACGAGETCPDFSASAAPMRFGYWRIAFGLPGQSIAHGIDNWKVTVWPR